MYTHESARGLDVQKRVLDPQELELEMVVDHQARSTCGLNC